MARNAREREGFLEEACAGDEALRLEVESLLDYQGNTKGFLAEPALEVAAKRLRLARGAGRGARPYRAAECERAGVGPREP